MRIVGGSLRGRKLAVPRGDAVRPTTDRTRETLFNILASRDALRGATVLDAFAGTGALGLEALSRGATSVTFMDSANASLALVRQNLETLGLSANVTRRDATRPGRGTPHSLVFLDPPYGKRLGEKAAGALQANGWLAPDALLVLEEAKTHAPDRLDGFTLVDNRTLGETVLGFHALLTQT